MPNQAGDQRPSGDNYEERQTGHAGNMPCLQDQAIPDWQGIAAKSSGSERVFRRFNGRSKGETVTAAISQSFCNARTGIDCGILIRRKKQKGQGARPGQ